MRKTGYAAVTRADASIVGPELYNALKYSVLGMRAAIRGKLFDVLILHCVKDVEL